MKYELKVAEEQDFEVFSGLVKQLHDYSIYSTFLPFVEETLREQFEASMGNSRDICTVLLRADDVVVGFISMAATPLLCSEDKIAGELGFWIIPEYRNRETIKLLVKSYRVWAKTVGCKATLMAKIKHKNAPEQFVCRRVI